MSSNSLIHTSLTSYISYSIELEMKNKTETAKSCSYLDSFFDIKINESLQQKSVSFVFQLSILEIDNLLYGVVFTYLNSSLWSYMFQLYGLH